MAQSMPTVINSKTIEIAKLEPGQFLLTAGQPALSDEDGALAANELSKAVVPGFAEWMLEVPRRWFN